MPIPGFEVPDPEDVPDADHNPRITEVRVGVVADGEQVGDALILQPGGLFTAPRESTFKSRSTRPRRTSRPS